MSVNTTLLNNIIVEETRRSTKNGSRNVVIFSLPPLDLFVYTLVNMFGCHAYRSTAGACLCLETAPPGTTRSICPSVLTLEMVSGMLKSFPPCSLKPHGAGPFRVTVYELVFASMWVNGGNKYSSARKVQFLLLPGPGLVWSGPVWSSLFRSSPR